MSLSKRTNLLSSRLLLVALLLVWLVPVSGQSMEFLAEGQPENPFHLVQKGETLYGIAKKHNLSINDLQKLNNLSQNSTIFPGQRLLVKNQVATTDPNARIAAAPVASSRGTLAPNANTEEDTYNQVTSLDMLGTASSRSLQPASTYRPASIKVEHKDFYQVKPGESVYTLADRFNVPLEQLREWNAVTEVKSGDVVVVRKWYEDVPQDAVDQPAPEAYNSRGLAAANTQVYDPAANARLASAGVTTRAAEPAYQAGYQAPVYKGTSVTAAPVTSRAVAPAPVQQGAYAYTPANARANNYQDQAAWLGAQVEQGPYETFEFEPAKDLRFYAVHKSLPAGTKIKLDIPNNAGYVEVMVIGKLSDQSRAFIGLSPACVALLQGAGALSSATIFYE